MSVAHDAAEGDDPINFFRTRKADNIEMNPQTLAVTVFDLMEAEDRSRPIDEHDRVGLLRQTLSRQRLNVFIGVRTNSVAIEQCGPEAGELGRVIAIENDFPDARHPTPSRRR